MKLLLVTGLLSAAVPLLATQPSPVPEPTTALVVGGGVAALILYARHRRRK